MTKTKLVVSDNTKDLKRIEAKIDYIKSKFTEHIKKEEVNEELKTLFVDKLSDLLLVLGDLSAPFFGKTLDKLEEIHIKENPQSPALGVKLALDEYQRIHAPYDRLKDSAYNYIEKIKKTEPNEIIRISYKTEILKK